MQQSHDTQQWLLGMLLASGACLVELRLGALSPRLSRQSKKLASYNGSHDNGAKVAV